MTVSYYAGWTFGKTISSASMTVTEATASLDFDITCDGSGIQWDDSAGGAKTVSDSATTYAHYGLDGVLGTDLYDDFATALQSALNSASSAHGNGWSYTVSYSTSTYLYSVSAAEGNTTLTFGSADMRNILGFTGDTGATATHTSDMRPYYVAIGYLPARSNLATYQEPGAKITSAIADDGTHYSISPQSLHKLYDWDQEFEADEADTIAGAGTGVFIREHGDTLVPWTWEHLFEHVRAREPIGVFDTTTPLGSELFVHYLRPDGAHFAPKRRQTDWDKWDIPFRTFWEGTEY